MPEDAMGRRRRGGVRRLWHVTLTVAGTPAEESEVREALERLAHERPFIHAGRYAAGRAEIRYWEEACDAHEASAMALQLWPEHRGTAGLPPWHVVGVEIVDQETHLRRVGEPVRAAALAASGDIRPF